MTQIDPRKMFTVACFKDSIGRQTAARRADLALRRRSVDLSRGAGRVDAALAARERGFVYFLRCEQFVKIGYSSTPHDRAGKVQTAVPFDVTLLGFIFGGTDLEKQLHAYFAGDHERGEWFRATPELLADVERILGR